MRLNIFTVLICLPLLFPAGALNAQEILSQGLDRPHATEFREALKLKDMLLQRIPEIKSVRLQIIGPVIGAHCGPGTLASCFMGKERKV